MKRPFGVSVIAILLIGVGVYGLVQLTLLGIDAGRFIAKDPDRILQFWQLWPRTVGIEDYFAVVTTMTSLVLSVLGLPLGWGMWRLRDWAWRLTIIALGFRLVTGLVGFFRGAPDYVTWIGSILIVLYLNQAEVKGIFATRTMGEAAQRG